MDHIAVFLMLLCFVISETSVAVELGDRQYLYHHFHSFHPQFPSHYVMNERISMLQESGSSMARHEKRDVEALLSFRNAITADPHGLLSNWTAQNSANTCSWRGIGCRRHSRRVVSIDLSFSGLEVLIGAMGQRSTGRKATCQPIRAHLIAVNYTCSLLMTNIMVMPLDTNAEDRGIFECRTGDSHQFNKIAHSMQRAVGCRNRELYDMEPAPRNSMCNSVEDCTNKRTTTGKRSRHTCCLKPDDNIHISIAGSCNSASLVLCISPEPNLVNLPLFQSHSSISVADMPRLRQRMRCKQGSSRSARRRSPSTSTSPSEISLPSENLHRLFHGRQFRSGRRLDSPSGDALPAQSHTALFSFDCARDRPRVSVAISVVFLEEPQPENPPDDSAPVDGANLEDVLLDSRGQTSERREVMQEDSARGPPHQTDTPSEVPHNVVLSLAHGTPADFGCRIEEVAPDE